MKQPVPELGDRLPRRGNRVTRFSARLLLRLMGWRVTGDLPNTAKLVVAVAPHTSLRDWSIGVVLLYALGIRASWLAKQELFWWPQRVVLNWLDALPVDRSSAHGLVEQVIRFFNHRSALVLAIAPEGTRKKPARWKTGFFYIARGAGAQIVLMAVDHNQKRIHFGPTYKAEGTPGQMIADMESQLRDRVAGYDELTGQG